LTVEARESKHGDRSEAAMMIERIGNWAWALTPAERLVAVQVTMAQHEGSEIGAGLARRYEAMRLKQAKLLALGVTAAGKMGLGRASRASPAGPTKAAGARNAATQDAAS
jgi:hypothetical protein